MGGLLLLFLSLCVFLVRGPRLRLRLRLLWIDAVVSRPFSGPGHARGLHCTGLDGHEVALARFG